MKKRFRMLEMFFSLLLVVALLHSVGHLAVFDEVDPSDSEGISGLSVGEEKVGENLIGKQVMASFSRVFVILEWFFVGIIVIFLHFRHRTGAEEEYSEVKSILQKMETETQTDLDKLYEVLKVRKTIRLSTISRAFNVNKEVAMDWCKTLESGNFASIEYPKFGEIILVLEESVKLGVENEKN